MNTRLNAIIWKQWMPKAFAILPTARRKTANARKENELLGDGVKIIICWVVPSPWKLSASGPGWSKKLPERFWAITRMLNMRQNMPELLLILCPNDPRTLFQVPWNFPPITEKFQKIRPLPLSWMIYEWHMEIRGIICGLLWQSLDTYTLWIFMHYQFSKFVGDDR